MNKKSPMYLHPSASGSKPRIARVYDKRFRPSAKYRASMPDIMDVAHDVIQGAHVPIQQVGVSNFKLPLGIRTKKGGSLTPTSAANSCLSASVGEWLSTRP